MLVAVCDSDGLTSSAVNKLDGYTRCVDTVCKYSGTTTRANITDGQHSAKLCHTVHWVQLPKDSPLSLKPPIIGLFNVTASGQIWQKGPSLPHMDGSIVFGRWRQCAPPSNTCFLRPTRVPKRHLDQFSHFCRAHDRDTDRPTDGARYSVCSNRPHLASTTMQPNNICISVPP